MTTTRQSYGLLAGLAAVATVTLVYLAYNDTGEPVTGNSGAAVDHPGHEQEIGSAQRIPAPVISGSPAPTDDQASVKTHGGKKLSTVSVSLGVDDAGVSLSVEEASLQEVLDALVGDALVEVVDLRSDSERISEPGRTVKRTFHITGSVDDVLHFVMHQYHHDSYVISRSPDSAALETQLAKLFLYGTSQGESLVSGSEAYDSIPAGEEAVPARPGHDAAVGGREKVDVGEILRQRALATSNRPLTPSAGAAGQDETHAGGSSLPTAKLTPSTQAPAGNTSPITGDYRDAETQARLAELTRKASQEVQALVESLRAAEQSLKTQQNNQYGDTEQ